MVVQQAQWVGVAERLEGFAMAVVLAWTAVLVVVKEVLRTSQLDKQDLEVQRSADTEIYGDWDMSARWEVGMGLHIDSYGILVAFHG